MRRSDAVFPVVRAVDFPHLPKRLPGAPPQLRSHQSAPEDGLPSGEVTLGLSAVPSVQTGKAGGFFCAGVVTWGRCAYPRCGRMGSCANSRPPVPVQL